MLFSGAGGITVTNGMVPGWIINSTENQFLTYTAENGFINAGFNAARSGALTATIVPTERTQLSAAATMTGGAGLVLDTYALRADASLTFANNSTAVATDRIRIQSGSLLAIASLSIAPGIEFGTGSGNVNGYIYINGTNTLTIGAAASSTVSTTAPGTTSATTGQITGALHILKHGTGTLQIDSPQPSFTGNWIVNQGNIFFRSTTVQSNLGGAASQAQRDAGTGGWVVLNSYNSVLGLRGDVTNTVFNLGVAIGAGVPQVQITADRAAGSGSSLIMQLDGGIRFGGSPGEQGQYLIFGQGNSFNIRVNGDVNLGPATIDGQTSFVFMRADTPVVFAGKLTGGAVFGKTGGSNFDFNNITTLNDFSGGLQILQGGTTTFRGTSTGTTAFPAVNQMTTGGVGSGAVTLWGGTLQLLYDVGGATTTRERFWVGNNTSGNSLIVNGSATINVNNNGGSTRQNKHLAFTDMTIGSQVLGVSNGNGYVLEINGATKLVSTPTLNVTSPMLLNGAVGDGGARAAIVKVGGGDLWLNGAASSFGGLLQGAIGANGLGIVINGGMLRFSDLSAEATVTLNMGTMLRSSTVRINPTGAIRLSSVNVTFAAGQIEQLSSGSQYSLFRLNSASVAAATLSSGTDIFSANSSGILALEGITYANSLNMATMGNGAYYLGAITASTYSGTSLTVGADNVYRLGGAGGIGVALTMDAASTTTGVLTGNARVLIGSQAGNGQGLVVLSDLNNYTGGTTVSRGSELRFNIAGTSTTLHPLGNTGAVDVFGTISTANTGTFLAFGSTTANHVAINLHPGSVLFLNNNTSAASANRWGDNVAVDLNGATLQMNTLGAGTGTETIGALSFQRSSQILLQASSANGQITLTTPSVTRTAGGTLAFTTQVGTTTTAGMLGIAPGNNSMRLIVSGGAAAITGGSFLPTVNMLPAYYINAADNTFVTYGANGFANAAFTKTVNAGDLSSTSIGATDIVDVSASALTLVQNLTLYALRVNQNINSGVGQYNSITFANGATDADRGGLISQTNVVALNVDLKFGTNGDKEGIIFTNANTLTINGDIYAGSMTKFGTANLTIAKDQTADARGSGGGLTGDWTVNQGFLQLNTFGASGTGMITLNPASNTTPTATATTATTTVTSLLLRANPGSALNGQYTMSKVRIVDAAIIDVSTGLADSTVSIGDLEIFSTDTTNTNPARARINIATQRSILGANVLSLTGTGASIIDVTATALNNQITAGVSTGLAVNSIAAGNRDLIKWGNGVLYIRGNNTGYTGNVYVEQGVLSVTTSGALAGANSITVRRYGALEIFAAGFNRAVTYEAGSVERWSVEGARSGAVNLGAATLQVAGDQFSTNATVTLNGGSIEGFLRSDDVLGPNNSVVYRTLGSDVSIVLAGNSFLGQDPLFGGPNGLQNGRTPDFNVGGAGSVGSDTNNSSNLSESARGVVLEIKGNISETGGSFGLSKQSLDTVILSGNNTYTGVTNVAGGTLRVTSQTGLSQFSQVRMYGSSVLDISVDDATTESTVPVVQATGLVSATVSGDFVSSAGFVTNSSTRVNTLRLGLNATTNSSFGGVIQNNLNLEKVGSRQQVLAGANTYFGSTTVSGGTLTVDGSVAGTGVTVANGGRLNGGFVGTPGVITSPVVVQSGGHYSAGSNSTGNVTTGDGVGQMNVIGSGVMMQWDAGSSFTFDFRNITGTEGTNWDFINVTGILKLNASTLGSLALQVDAWKSDNSGYGNTGNSFNPNTPTTWSWVTATGFVDSANNPINDGVVDLFAVNGTGSTGVFGSGAYSPASGSNFWVSKSGNRLFVNYGVSAVPEPGSLLLVSLAGLGFAGYRRRRRKAGQVAQTAEQAEKIPEVVE
ncbi:MAG: autotransporter-associated beta strand repeat-containing protein [Pirellulales bacterium]